MLFFAETIFSIWNNSISLALTLDHWHCSLTDFNQIYRLICLLEEEKNKRNHFYSIERFVQHIRRNCFLLFAFCTNAFRNRKYKSERIDSINAENRISQFLGNFPLDEAQTEQEIEGDWDKEKRKILWNGHCFVSGKGDYDFWYAVLCLWLKHANAYDGNKRRLLHFFECKRLLMA